MFNKRIRDRICEMSCTLAAAQDTEEFMEDMVQFYKDFGVGKLGLHKAFRIERDEKGKAQIVPITRIAHVRLDDLVGYEIPKQKLIEHFDTHEDLAHMLKMRARPGDVILFKGSRGMRMEKALALFFKEEEE